MFDIVRNIMESTIERIMNWAVPLDTFNTDWNEEDSI